jgi:hypothetical protein
MTRWKASHHRRHGEREEQYQAAERQNVAPFRLGRGLLEAGIGHHPPPEEGETNEREQRRPQHEEQHREIWRGLGARRYVEDVASSPGWLIFKLPPAELGVHPSEGSTFFLHERCGGVSRNLLPQGAMVLSLAVGFGAPSPRTGFCDDVERWVWCSYFTQAYAQGVNTRAVTDAEELLTWAVDADKKPTAVRILETQPELIAERLRDSRKETKFSSAV